MLLLPTATVDLKELKLIRDGETMSLTPHEATLLRYLASQDRTVDRRELLREVWGYAPSVRSRAVDATVSRLRAKLEPVPSEPRSLLSVRGRGYRLVRLESLRPTVLFGRDEERRRVRHLLAEHPGVQLIGRGGSGKTALARDLAVDRSVRFFDLSGSTRLDDALGTLADALGLDASAHTPSSLRARLTATLEELDVVVILDNLEQLEQAGDLVDCIRDARRPVVVTSRVTVTDALPTMPIGRLAGQPARDLLLRAAGRTQAGWTTSSAELDAIVEGVEGLALALELVGARLPLHPGSAWARDTPRLLDLGDGREGRHATLAHCIAWSWDRMDRDVRRHLAWWSCFSGPLDVDGLEAVSGAGARDALLQATRAGWVDTRGELPRLRPSIQAFCADRLTEAGERAEAEHAHASWVAEQVPFDPERWQGTDAPALRRRARLLRPDLVLALGRMAQPCPSLAARVGLGLLVQERALTAEAAREAAERVLDAAERSDEPVLHLEARIARLAVAGRARDAERDRRDLEIADRLATQCPGRWATLARLEQRRGHSLRAAGDLDGALAAAERGRDHAERAGLLPLVARLDHDAGATLVRLGRPARARARLVRSVAAAHALGDPELCCLGYQALAAIERRGDALDRARDLGERAVHAGRQGDSLDALGGALTNLANILFSSGDLAEAEALQREATEVLHRGGFQRTLSIALGNLAEIVELRGDPLESELLLTRAHLMALRAHVPYAAAVWRGKLAELQHKRHSLDEALASYALAEAELAAQNAVTRAARIRACTAIALAQLGRTDEARTALEQATPLLDQGLDDQAVHHLARFLVAHLAGDAVEDPMAAHPHDLAWVQERPELHTIRVLWSQVLGGPESGSRA